MKKIVLISILLSFMAINNYSQEQDTYELEIKHEGPGKVTLKNGDELNGIVEYSLTANHKLRLKKEGDEKGEKYTTSDVKEFTVNDMHFILLKATGLETFGLVLSKPEYKIQTIELTTQFAGGSPSDEGFKHRTTRETYFRFLKQDKLMRTSDIGFTNKKLAELTSDCPELSKKIANKSAEYKIGFMTPDPKKLEIIQAITEAYQNCN